MLKPWSVLGHMLGQFNHIVIQPMCSRLSVLGREPGAHYYLMLLLHIRESGIFIRIKEL